MDALSSKLINGIKYAFQQNNNNESTTFDKHVSNDDRFKRFCSRIIEYVLQSSENVSLEIVLSNIIILYTVMFFNKTSIMWNDSIMHFLVRFPLRLRTIQDVHNYMEMYQEHVNKTVLSPFQ
jgi:predicted PurR-regulated permease PerM